MGDPIQFEPESKHGERSKYYEDSLDKAPGLGSFLGCLYVGYSIFLEIPLDDIERFIRPIVNVVGLIFLSG